MVTSSGLELTSYQEKLYELGLAAILDVTLRERPNEAGVA